MTTLSEKEVKDILLSTENMQRPKVWTQHISGVPVQFGFDPGHDVGDVTSEAKGSGARFNAGKVPYELVPLAMMSDYFVFVASEEPRTGADPIAALCGLGEFQARAGDDHDNLLGALLDLGTGGWEECARVFDYGKAKYAAWNWAKGMKWSIPIACAARHLLAMIDGEEIDPESGLPHRGHVFCNIAMLYTFGRSFLVGDDRAPAGRLA